MHSYQFHPLGDDLLTTGFDYPTTNVIPLLQKGLVLHPRGSVIEIQVGAATQLPLRLGTRLPGMDFRENVFETIVFEVFLTGLLPIFAFRTLFAEAHFGKSGQMLAGVEEVHNLGCTRKLFGRNLPDPGRTIRQNNHIPATVMSLLVGKSSQERTEDFGVVEGCDVSTREDLAISACFILTRFIRDTDLALTIPTGQGAFASILLPGIAQGNKDAVQANVEPPSCFALRFWQTVIMMERHRLLLFLAQCPTHMKRDPL
jgi:hypothetical protein